MTNSPKENRKNTQLGIRVGNEIAHHLREIAEHEHRNINQQFEVIFLEWLEMKQRKAIPKASSREVRELGVTENKPRKQKPGKDRAANE